MTRSLRLAVIAMLTLYLSAASGCTWRAKIRENERKVAAANVRIYHQHRKWDHCVASADRAQAVRDLDPDLAAEITSLKAWCLMELDRPEESLAHYRLLRDFLLDASQLDLAFPKEIKGRLMHERSLDDAKALPHNQSLLTLDVPGAYFPRAAKWSDVAGSAIVQWTITKKGVSRDIRVLNDVHPLLAGLAIEAAASTTLESEANQDRLPLRKRVSFLFGEP